MSITGTRIRGVTPRPEPVYISQNRRELLERERKVWVLICGAAICTEEHDCEVRVLALICFSS